MKAPLPGVFVNCPFDEEYKPLFEAIVFAITACRYRVRCALEEVNGADIRFDKLTRIIDECSLSIHDLSRTELNHLDLPRFNMPFELGLVMGARRFGTKKHQSKSALIMVREPYRLPAYLSDLGGNDPSAHRGEPLEVVRIVRRYLQSGLDQTLPGARHIHSKLSEFQNELPGLAERANVAPAEVDPLKSYQDYINFLASFLKANPVI